ncbi:MAG: TetR/AcrR family transcriptional regulator [Clostridia bacterium]|nr:TetR/AcrR family transcriptional regulator [Clostridia bacterium]
MNNSRTKYNNSAMRMTAALLKLLDKKTLDKITIRELCDEAGVNRSTFYTHYDTIEDILEEARRIIVDEFIERMDARKKAGADEDVLTAYLELIKKHMNFYRIHMETTNPLSFTEMFKERILSSLHEKHGADAPVIDENRIHYMARYYLLGIYAVIKEWVDGGCDESVDYIHSIIHDCTVHS